VRLGQGRPIAVGIVLVYIENDDCVVYTAHEGRDKLGLIAGCHSLARRLDDELVHRAAPPGPDEEP
jgi:hypothetical protein